MEENFYTLFAALLARHDGSAEHGHKPPAATAIAVAAGGPAATAALTTRTTRSATLAGSNATTDPTTTTGTDTGTGTHTTTDTNTSTEPAASTGAGTAAATGLRKRSSRIEPHVPASLADKQRATANQALAGEVLTTLLKSMTLVGLIMAVFGQAYAALALHLYGGTLLSQGDGPLLLRAYAAYVLAMALNGMTEAFVAAVREGLAEVQARMLLQRGISGG